MVFLHGKLCGQVAARRKSITGACRTELPAKIVLTTRLGMDSGNVWQMLQETHIQIHSSSSFTPCSAAVRAQHMELKPSWLLKPQKTSAPAHFYLLKLSVFKKLRLGGLRARFWRPRGSILEGPGLIFEGFGRFKRCLKAFLGGERFATDLS